MDAAKRTALNVANALEKWAFTLTLDTDRNLEDSHTYGQTASAMGSFARGRTIRAPGYVPQSSLWN